MLIMIARWPMPGDQTDSLLRSCVWESEKMLRKRGNFSSVLFVAERADGTRQRLERFCNNAPSGVTDADLLTALAEDVAVDFAEIGVRPFRLRVSVQTGDHAAADRPRFTEENNNNKAAGCLHRAAQRRRTGGPVPRDPALVRRSGHAWPCGNPRGG